MPEPACLLGIMPARCLSPTASRSVLLGQGWKAALRSSGRPGYGGYASGIISIGLSTSLSFRTVPPISP